MNNNQFLLQNPWHKAPVVKIDIPIIYSERTILEEISKWLDSKDIIVITGPRQSGKTTILKKLINLLSSTAFNPQNIFYFSCDAEIESPIFSSINDFINFIYSYSPKKEEKKFIFLDEVQFLKEPGLFLKNVYDLDINFKFIVSGSSSLEIKSHLKETLTGRKKLFFLYPFSFKEFLILNNAMPPSLFNKDLFAQIQNFSEIYLPQLNQQLEQYLQWGGYPKVLLQKTPEKKIAELKEIVSSYIKKDVIDFLKIDNAAAFNKLVSILAYQIGNLINKKELSNTLQISWVTIEKYLHILEDTFVVHLLPPFFSNKRKEITKMKKNYYIDLGLRNFIINNFSDISSRGDRGILCENFSVIEFHKILTMPMTLNFWRTQAGGEIDIIIVSGNKILPIEIKSTVLQTILISKSFRHFISLHKPKYVLLANLNLHQELQIENTKIIAIPLSWLLLDPLKTIKTFLA